MWIATIICIVLLIAAYSAEVIMVMKYNTINEHLRLVVVLGMVPVFVTCLCLLFATSGLDAAKKELNKEKPKYELIQEPVYRKIK
jgi:hypothetical protein